MVMLFEKNYKKLQWKNFHLNFLSNCYKGYYGQFCQYMQSISTQQQATTPCAVTQFTTRPNCKPCQNANPCQNGGQCLNINCKAVW